MPLGPKTLALRRKVADLLALYDGPGLERIDYIVKEMGISRHAAAVLIVKVALGQRRKPLMPPIYDGH